MPNGLSNSFTFDFDKILFIFTQNILQGMPEHFVETRQSHPFKMFTGEEYGEGWTGLNILSNCTIGKNSK